jgi:GT2 family glycosyltransferase
MAQPPVSIVIPTTGRAAYLDVALASLAPQARDAGAELIVVAHGHHEDVREVARKHGAHYEAIAARGGINVVRNAGARTASARLIAFVDDDVEAPATWLPALLQAADTDVDAEAFGGPIHARLEGARVPRGCGRDDAPISALDLGPEDLDAAHAWGANFAVRRSALERVGWFDERLVNAGDEEEWQDRLRAAGGRVRYVAAMGLDHRRSPQDSRLRPLMRAAHERGRAARRWDAFRGESPPLRAELRNTLGAAVWHTLRRRCANGLVTGAHNAGRLREALAARRVND